MFASGTTQEASSKELRAAKKPDLILNVFPLIFTVPAFLSPAIIYTFLCSLSDSFISSLLFISLLAFSKGVDGRKERKVGMCLVLAPCVIHHRSPGNEWLKGQKGHSCKSQGTVTLYPLHSRYAFIDKVSGIKIEAILEGWSEEKI